MIEWLREYLGITDDAHRMGRIERDFEDLTRRYNALLGFTEALDRDCRAWIGHCGTLHAHIEYLQKCEIERRRGEVPIDPLQAALGRIRTQIESGVQS